MPYDFQKNHSVLALVCSNFVALLRYGKIKEADYSDLSQQNLSYGDLSNADFTESSLCDADISHANIDNAWFLYTQLAGIERWNVDDSKIKGRRELPRSGFPKIVFI